MQQPCQRQPRTSVASQVLIWAIGALILVTGVLSSSTAWANNICPGSSTIPVTPMTLFLRDDGSPSTYQIGLCEEPTDPVHITVTAAPPARVVVTPTNFILTTTVSQTVEVALAPTHPKLIPFTAVLTHSAQSDDPRYDVGATGVPTVTVHYLPPLAVLDLAFTRLNQSVDINVKANDIDRLGQGITVTAITIPPARGAATILPNQNVRYTPAPGHRGWDAFRYRITDAIGNTSEAWVVVLIVPTHKLFTQLLLLSYGPAGQHLLQTPFGSVLLQLPAGFLKGNIPDGAPLALGFSEMSPPTCATTSLPGTVGRSNLAFEVDMTLVESSQVLELEKPLTVTVTFQSDHAKANFFVLRCDGVNWTDAGIEMLDQSDSAAPISAEVDRTDATVSLTFNTMQLGEYGLFYEYHIFLPVTKR